MRTYLCIDLKSFYASVECVERGLDPLTANLVVADESRTEKTVCLAVSPSLKKFGIPGRARLFEVVERIKQVNLEKLNREGKDYKSIEFIIAKPQMAKYINVSSEIYKVYLTYFAPEDIHVYSIDEVFIDLTNYLGMYQKTAHDLAMEVIRKVLSISGITATAGIGTNMYLAKIAMDIIAKKTDADKDGVRIAELDVRTYREKLWNHSPLTDFWRVGRGIAKNLAQYGITTMGEIARMSLTNEDFFYKKFGVNAELLIDHAWGIEPCEMRQIKAYRPLTKSLSSGQVLHEPYNFEKARTIVKEMIDNLTLDMVDKQLVGNQIVISVGYDVENLKKKDIRERYSGEIDVDRYGRAVPKSGHGSGNLQEYTSSNRLFSALGLEIFDRIVDKNLLIRRINISVNNLKKVDNFSDYSRQNDLFLDNEEQKEGYKRENEMQKAMLKIKKRYGKNAILKGINFLEGATGVDRNEQIGGHHE